MHYFPGSNYGRKKVAENTPPNVIANEPGSTNSFLTQIMGVIPLR